METGLHQRRASVVEYIAAQSGKHHDTSRRSSLAPASAVDQRTAIDSETINQPDETLRKLSAAVPNLADLTVDAKHGADNEKQMGFRESFRMYPMGVFFSFGLSLAIIVSRTAKNLSPYIDLPFSLSLDCVEASPLTSTDGRIRHCFARKLLATTCICREIRRTQDAERCRNVRCVCLLAASFYCHKYFVHDWPHAQRLVIRQDRVSLHHDGYLSSYHTLFVCDVLCKRYQDVACRILFDRSPLVSTASSR